MSEAEALCSKSKEQLEREHVVREALEAAARKVESLTGATGYEYAWKRAAREIRAMKP